MLEEKIHNDYKEAMKSRDALKSSVLSFLRAQIINAQVSRNKKSLDDLEVISVIKKQVKQRQDSIEQFEQGGRLEMARKERDELAILKTYLPPELPDDELARLIEEAVKESGAQGLESMGAVIKDVMAKSGGRAEGKRVSVLVKQQLTKGDNHA